MPAFDVHVKTSPVGAAVDGTPDQGDGAFGQVRVRMQEQQRVGTQRGRHTSASVHLGRTSARRHHDLVDEGRGTLHGVILAAAIDHHHVHTAVAVRRQRLQTGRHLIGFIQHRNHDGELHATKASASSSKP